MTINKYYKEIDYVEELLTKRKLDTSVKSDLKILAKYYKSQGMTYADIEEMLYEFCNKKCKAWFNKVLHYKMVDSAVNHTRKKENVLVQIESIPITKSEMDYLESLDYDIIEKKILFSFIVIDKLKRKKAELRGFEANDSHYFGGSGEYSYKSLMEILNEKLTRTYKEKGIHKTIKRFNDDGLTRTTQKTALQLLFIDKIKLDNGIVIEINDFDNIGLYYDLYIGDEKVKLCEECSVNLVKINGQHKKYCDKCQIKIRQETWRNSKRKMRMSTSS